MFSRRSLLQSFSGLLGVVGLSRWLPENKAAAGVTTALDGCGIDPAAIDWRKNGLGPIQQFPPLPKFVPTPLPEPASQVWRIPAEMQRSIEMAYAKRGLSVFGDFVIWREKLGDTIYHVTDRAAQLTDQLRLCPAGIELKPAAFVIEQCQNGLRTQRLVSEKIVVDIDALRSAQKLDDLLTQALQDLWQKIVAVPDVSCTSLEVYVHLEAYTLTLMAYAYVGVADAKYASLLAECERLTAEAARVPRYFEGSRVKNYFLTRLAIHHVYPSIVARLENGRDALPEQLTSSAARTNLYLGG